MGIRILLSIGAPGVWTFCIGVVGYTEAAILFKLWWGLRWHIHSTGEVTIVENFNLGDTILRLQRVCQAFGLVLLLRKKPRSGSGLRQLAPDSQLGVGRGEGKFERSSC